MKLTRHQQQVKRENMLEKQISGWIQRWRASELRVKELELENTNLRLELRSYKEREAE